MGQDIVRVPTVKGVSGAFKDFGIGAVAGAILIVAFNLFGGLGFLAAPLLAGSMIKGENAKAITTLSGVALGVALLSGFGGKTSQATGNNEVVM